MVRTIFSIFILITSYQFCQGQQKVIIYYDTLDQVKETYTILNNDSSLIDGDYKTFYITGETALTGIYDHGMKSGVFTEFYRSGGKKRVIQFSDIENLEYGNDLLRIDVKNYPTGMYYYKIETEESVYAGKVMIQR